MAVVDRSGLPLAISIASASPHESTLVADVLRARFLPKPTDRPLNLIGDRAYDSDALREELADQGITLIAPNRSNRNVLTQDRRRLRRYRRRWKVERFFAWLQNFRRLVIRYEHHAENFLGMLHIACALLLLRYL